MNRNFREIVRSVDFSALEKAIGEVRVESVQNALARTHLDDMDALALFSPAASEFLETIARRAAALTERRFGKVIQLYAPLYLSNECANVCVYCGFSAGMEIKRVSLTVPEALKETEHLHSLGLRHILLLTGDTRGRFGVERIAEFVEKIRGRFASISLEVFPMSVEEYRRLESVGVDGLTLYQETYDPDLYAKLHLKGPKKNFDRRVRNCTRL